jgi:hypothetical protein
MEPIPVRAHGAIGLGHLLLAAGFVAAAAYYTDVLLGVIGLLNLWLAYSWAMTPTFTLFHNRVETYSRLGTVRRQRWFVGLDLLEVRGRQLYLQDARLPVADATLARAGDWQRVVDAIEARVEASVVADDEAEPKPSW